MGRDWFSQGQLAALPVCPVLANAVLANAVLANAVPDNAVPANAGAANDSGTSLPLSRGR